MNWLDRHLEAIRNRIKARRRLGQDLHLWDNWEQGFRGAPEAEKKRAEIRRVLERLGTH